MNKVNLSSIGRKYVSGLKNRNLCLPSSFYIIGKTSSALMINAGETKIHSSKGRKYVSGLEKSILRIYSSLYNIGHTVSNLAVKKKQIFKSMYHMHIL